MRPPTKDMVNMLMRPPTKDMVIQRKRVFKTPAMAVMPIRRRYHEMLEYNTSPHDLLPRQPRYSISWGVFNLEPHPDGLLFSFSSKTKCQRSNELWRKGKVTSVVFVVVQKPSKRARSRFHFSILLLFSKFVLR